MSDLRLNIVVGYDGKGLNNLFASLNAIRDTFRDVNRSVGTSSNIGNVAKDIQRVGTASRTANRNLSAFITTLNRLNTSAATRTMGNIQESSNAAARSARDLTNAQRSLSAALQSSNDQFRRVAQSTRSMTSEQTRAVAAQAALTKAAAQSKNADTRRMELQYRKERDAIRDSQRAQAQAARAAQQHAAQMARVYQNVIQVIVRLANTIRSTLTAAIQTASTAIGRFGSSAASRFATLRSSLDATGRSFINLRNNIRSTGTTFNQMWSGDALMRAGRNLMQFTNQGNMLVRRMYTDFAGVEQSVSRAAVAGIDPIFRYERDGREVTEQDYLADPTGVRRIRTGWSPIPMDDTWDFVYRLQRGEFEGTTPIRSLTTQELADATYFLTSAIGAGVGTGVNDPQSQAIARMLGPMAIFASATQTSPEDYIKGVLGIGQQFGYNPRDFTTASTGDTFAGISGMVALLANMSAMEPSDVVQAMRMVGPQSFLAFGGQDALAWDANVREKALFDTFIAMFAASEVGLRGSQTGRAYQRMFSGLADATPKTRRVLSEAFGFDPSEYEDWLYNERGVMDFDGRGEGILGLVRLMQDYRDRPDTTPGDLQRLIAELFTENATRGMAATLAGMDSPAIQELVDVVEEAQRTGDWTAAFELLDQVMLQETALVSNAVTNMANAWGQFVNSVIRASDDLIIGGLDVVANVFREIADIVMDFPNLGKYITTAFSGLLVGASLLAGLLMLAGTLVSVSRAMNLIGISAGLVARTIVGFPLAFAKMIPILLLVGAAIVTLRAAWENNFLGMQDTITSLMETLREGDLSGMFAEWLSSDSAQNTLMWLTRIKDAFTELVAGVLFNIGPMNNLGAMLNHVFGDLLGGYLFDRLGELRVALVGFREDVAALAGDLGGNLATGIRNLAQLGIGFLEIFFTGQFGARAFSASRAMEEWLGIENFDDALTNFALAQRENFSNVLAYIRSFGSAIGDIFDQIRANLGQVFTLDNLVTALQTVMAFIQGIGVGLATSLMGALRTIELVTRALANMGDAGRFVADLVKDLTGLQVTLEGVAQALGVAVGIFAGSRFLTPLLLFNTALRTGVAQIAGFGLALVGLTMQALTAVAGFGLLGGAVAILGATFTAALAVMFAYTAYTQGMEAAMQGLVEAWNGFRDVLEPTIERLATVVSNIIDLALEIAGISNQMVTFETIGRGLGHAISFIAEVAVYAVGGVVLFGAALFRIAREYGPAVLSTMRDLGPVVATAIATAVLGVAGLITAFNELRGYVIGFAATFALLWVAFNFNPLMLAISAVVIALAGVGVAILAITGDAETMSSGLAGIVEMLPEPWQEAADSIVLIMMRAFDKIREGYANLPLIDYSYDPKDSYELQYGLSRGKISPQEYDEFLGRGASRSNFLGGGDEYSYSDQRYLHEIRDDILFLNEAYGVSIGSPSNHQKYLPYGYWQSLSRNVNAPNVSEEDFLIAQEMALQQTVGSDIDRINQVNAMLGYSDRNALGLAISSDGIYTIYDTGVPIQEYYKGYESDFVPLTEMFNPWSPHWIGHGPKTSTGGSNLAPNTGFAGIAEYLGLPAGVDPTPENVAKHLGYSYDPNRGLREQFDEWGLSGPIAEELERYEVWQEERDKYEQWMKLVDDMGLDSAALYWQQEIGTPIPVDPGDFRMGLDDAGDEALDAAEEFAEKFAEANKTVLDALRSQTDPFEAISNWFDFNQGRGVAGGSVASFMNDMFPSISEAVGDSPWFNQMEMIADLGGMGLLGENLYGVNVRDQLRPYFERLSRETGVAVDELMADIPKWFAPDEVVALAATEFAKGWNDMPQEVYDKLDHFGIQQGWTEFGMDWADMVDYASSMAMEGKEWNLIDYFVDSLGMTREQAIAELDALGIDFNAISSEWMEGSIMLARSMAEGVNIISEETFNTVNDLMATQGDATMQILRMTEEQFALLTDDEKRFIQIQGWSIVITEPEVEGPSAEDLEAKGQEEARKHFEAYERGYVSAHEATGGYTISPTIAVDPHYVGYTFDEPLWSPTKPSTPASAPSTPAEPPKPPPIEQDVNINFKYSSGGGDSVADSPSAAATSVATEFTEEFESNIQADIPTAISDSFSGVEVDPAVVTGIAESLATQFVETFSETLGEALASSLSESLGESLTTALTEALTGFGDTLGQFSAGGEGEEGTGIDIPVKLDIETLLVQLATIPPLIEDSLGTEYEIVLTGNYEPLLSVIDGAHVALDVLVARENTVIVGADIDEAIALIGSVHTALDVLVERDDNVSIGVIDNATTVLENIAKLMTALNGRVSTMTVRVERIGEAMATGGFTRSNLTLVGEEGPEFVRLPWGSRVFNADETLQMRNSIRNAYVPSRSIDDGASIQVEQARHRMNTTTYDRAVVSASKDSQRPIVIDIGDVTITETADVDELIEKIDYELGRMGQFALRGQTPIDGRSYDD